MILRPHPEGIGAWTTAFVFSSTLHVAAGVFMLDMIPFNLNDQQIDVAFPDIAISNITLQEPDEVPLEPETSTGEDPEALAPEELQPEELAAVEPEALDPGEAEELAPTEPEALEPEAAEELAPVEPEPAEEVAAVEPEALEEAEKPEPVEAVEPEAPIAEEASKPDAAELAPVIPDETAQLAGATAAPAPQAPARVAPVAAAQAVQTAAVSQVTKVAPVTVARPKPAAAPAPPPPELSEEDKKLLELIDRIRNRFGDECLIALPANQGAGQRPLVTIISDSDRTMSTFETEVLNDPELEVDSQQILTDSRQCALLDYARAQKSYPTFRVDLRLRSRVVESGGNLRGAIGNLGGRYTSLLLIDSNGVVQDLRRFTRFTAGAAEFDVPVTINGPQRDTSSLLMAIASPGRPATVTQLGGRLAEDFFAPLGAELGDAAAIAILPFDIR